MAERRMFTKKITDSDAFFEMSSAAQALYFHLNQGADDDGFNNQVQIAMFKSHASVDDLKVLLCKNFIIRFESGVIVIKHWRMHNTLRKDRYIPTNFQEELAKLNIKENGAYTISDNIGCQTVAKRLPQVRLGKDRLGKVSIEGECNEPKALPAPFDEIKDYFNTVCVSYPKIISLSDKRKTALKGLINTYSVEKVKEVFDKAEKSDFMKGTNDRKWSATFDWIINPTNFLKVLEGNFDNKSNNSNSSFDTDEFFNLAVKRGMEKYNA